MNPKNTIAIFAAGLLGLCAYLPATAAPIANTFDFQFNTANAGASFSFKAGSAGCVIAQVTALNASDKGVRLNLSNSRSLASVIVTPQTTDTTWLSFTVPSATNGTSWMLSVSSLNGTAKGTVRIEYPPTQVPCAFKAQPSSNQVALSWLSPTKASGGTFLVERSDSRSGTTWRAVRGCSVPARGSAGPISCKDSGLSKGEYRYRVCLVGSGSRCGTANVTPPLLVSIK